MSGTGATAAQIDAAVERSLAALRRDCGIDGPRREQEVLIGLAAAMLVPADHRIVGPDEISAIGLMAAELRRLHGMHGDKEISYEAWKALYVAEKLSGGGS